MLNCDMVMQRQHELNQRLEPNAQLLRHHIDHEKRETIKASMGV